MKKEDFLQIYEVFNKILEEKERYESVIECKNITDFMAFYNQAKKERSVKLTSNVLLIANIKNGLSAYKTIVIFRNGEIKITKDSVKQLLKNNFFDCGISYEDFKEVVEKIYEHRMYKIPYVYNNLSLIQINGENKDDCIWINVSNISSYELYNNKIKIKFINGYYYLASITEESFIKQIERVKKLYLLQKEYVNDMCLKVSQVSEKSILTKELTYVKYTQSELEKFNFYLHCKKIQQNNNLENLINELTKNKFNR